MALVEAISECARSEAATAGRRLAAIAELATRRCGTELAASRERWACDAWDSCAAEVAAELTISHRTASGLMHQGLDLRTHSRPWGRYSLRVRLRCGSPRR